MKRFKRLQQEKKAAEEAAAAAAAAAASALIDSHHVAVILPPSIPPPKPVAPVEPSISPLADVVISASSTAPAAIAASFIPQSATHVLAPPLIVNDDRVDSEAFALSSSPRLSRKRSAENMLSKHQRHPSPQRKQSRQPLPLQLPPRPSSPARLAPPSPIHVAQPPATDQRRRSRWIIKRHPPIPAVLRRHACRLMLDSIGSHWPDDVTPAFHFERTRCTRLDTQRQWIPLLDNMHGFNYPTALNAPPYHPSQLSSAPVARCPSSPPPVAPHSSPNLHYRGSSPLSACLASPGYSSSAPSPPPQSPFDNDDVMLRSPPFNLSPSRSPLPPAAAMQWDPPPSSEPYPPMHHVVNAFPEVIDLTVSSDDDDPPMAIDNQPDNCLICTSSVAGLTAEAKAEHTKECVLNYFGP